MQIFIVDDSNKLNLERKLVIVSLLRTEREIFCLRCTIAIIFGFSAIELLHAIRFHVDRVPNKSKVQSTQATTLSTSILACPCLLCSTRINFFGRVKTFNTKNKMHCSKKQIGDSKIQPTNENQNKKQQEKQNRINFVFINNKKNAIHFDLFITAVAFSLLNEVNLNKRGAEKKKIVVEYLNLTSYRQIYFDFEIFEYIWYVSKKIFAQDRRISLLASQFPSKRLFRMRCTNELFTPKPKRQQTIAECAQSSHDTKESAMNFGVWVQCPLVTHRGRKRKEILQLKISVCVHVMWTERKKTHIFLVAFSSSSSFCFTSSFFALASWNEFMLRRKNKPE